MSSKSTQLHFVLIPLMSPGHLIPMIDIAKLLANHGMIVTIVTTPLNALKFCTTIERAIDSGLKINILELKFPATEAGLPEGCESVENIPSRDMIKNFFKATRMLQEPFEQALETMQPRPSCVISGKNLPWTVETARKLGIPRIFFDGMGCFAFSCTHKLEVSQVHKRVVSKFEPFLVPDMPHRVQLTLAKLPESLKPSSRYQADVMNTKKGSDFMADGIVVNSFEELETEYVKEYRKVKGDRVWCIGPVSACNKLNLDKSERGTKASIDEEKCLKWLDLWPPGSVIYACLGSISRLTKEQLMEIGLGLEASNYPFIWVIGGGNKSEALMKWVKEEGFEERTKERGLVIQGWAPQALILSHNCVGGFLTHCGWNSTLEGVAAGVPMVTCPLFAEQFYNEKLVVEVLGIGVNVGVEGAVEWGMEDKFELVIRREQVKEGVVKVMDRGENGEEMRRKATALGCIAKRAIEEGGSSFINIQLLIQYVREAVEVSNIEQM